MYKSVRGVIWRVVGIHVIENQALDGSLTRIVLLVPLFLQPSKILTESSEGNYATRRMSFLTFLLLRINFPT